MREEVPELRQGDRQASKEDIMGIFIPWSKRNNPGLPNCLFMVLLPKFFDLSHHFPGQDCEGVEHRIGIFCKRVRCRIEKSLNIISSNFVFHRSAISGPERLRDSPKTTQQTKT